MPLTPEELERRRELARTMHSEVADPATGRRKFGGPQPGSGRPRKKRASEIVADRVAHDAPEIYQAFKDGLKAKQPHVRMQAARDMLAIEAKEAELKIKEERALEEVPTDELIELVADRFSALAEAGLAPEFDLEGRAEEIEPALLSPPDGEVYDESGVGSVGETPRTGGTSPFARRARD